MGDLIGDRSEGELLRLVEREIKKKAKGSELLSEEVEATITKFDLGELSIGHELGRGGFCSVHELLRIKLVQADEEAKAPNGANGYFSGDEIKKALGNSFLGQFVGDDSKQNNVTSQKLLHNREDMAENFCEKLVPEEGGGFRYRYAVKAVRDDAKKDAESFVRAVLDLTLEARFLAVLQHPSIINMKAMAKTSPYKAGRPYFIILEKLEDILSNRFSAWKTRMPSHVWPCCVPPEDKAFWNERLNVAYSVAGALEYLHGRNVIYRDVKPDNIGFDAEGHVKLFDFGLAREMQKKLRTVEGTFQLTAGTGFPPYMAPEVLLAKPYNESVDVHSFSILLWQILKVEVPFGEDMDDKRYITQVVEGGARPPLDDTWPDELLECMKLGWSEVPSDRPSMTTVTKTLGESLTDDANGS